MVIRKLSRLTPWSRLRYQQLRSHRAANSTQSRLAAAMPNTMFDGHAATAALFAWDKACLLDEAREKFVVPTLAEIITRIRPSRFVDIGAKTGYLIDRLLAISEPIRSCQIVAIERDRHAADFMKTRFQASPMVRIDCAAIQDWEGLPEVNSSTLYLLSYTALELDDRSLASTFTRPGPNDTFVVVLPDTAEDIASSIKWRPYLTGTSVRLEKIDKFTGQTYPFIARRLSSWLPVALDAGLALTQMRAYRSLTERVHFLFEFQRFANA